MAGEPMTLEQALAYLKPADANNGTISLRAPKAREAVAVIAAEIAALQSRAFEDGARWMRERAFDVARAWQMPAAPPTADETLIARVQARNETVAGIAAGIMALHPEGERNA